MSQRFSAIVSAYDENRRPLGYSVLGVRSRASSAYKLAKDFAKTLNNLNQRAFIIAFALNENWLSMPTPEGFEEQVEVLGADELVKRCYPWVDARKRIDSDPEIKLLLSQPLDEEEIHDEFLERVYRREFAKP